jgi:hypothetical protein
MDARQIEPYPPEVLEAGEHPVIDYENPLAAMARAEATSKTMRFVEAITPIAQVDGGAVYDYLNTDAMIPGMAEEIGVKPQYVRSPEEVAQIARNGPSNSNRLNPLSKLPRRRMPIRKSPRAMP